MLLFFPFTTRYHSVSLRAFLFVFVGVSLREYRFRVKKKKEKKNAMPRNLCRGNKNYRRLHFALPSRCVAVLKCAFEGCLDQSFCFVCLLFLRGVRSVFYCMSLEISPCDYFCLRRCGGAPLACYENRSSGSFPIMMPVLESSLPPRQLAGGLKNAVSDDGDPHW